MATQYTPNLKLSLPTQGELSGTWGNEVNNGITSMVEDAIAGQVTINTWSNNVHILTTASGAASEARNMILKFTDTNSQIGAAIATVKCPSLSKVYCVENATSKSILVKPDGGTGETIPSGQSAILRCDGSKVVYATTPFEGNTIGVSVEEFGVKSDGVTDDSVALQAAADFAATNRRTLTFERGSSFIRTTTPIYIRSHSHWFGDAEIKNTNTAADIQSSVLLGGGFNPVYFDAFKSDIVDYTHYPINAVNSGRTITTTTGSDASNFAVGDLVWVSTTKTWVGSAGNYPVTAHLSKVLTLNGSTGVITLETPISERMAAEYGDLRVCNAQETGVLDKLGNQLEFCEQAVIDGISLSAPFGNALTRGGMYKCDFNFKNITGKNCIFANAFVNTSVRAQTVTATRKACDIAGFSNSFYIGIDSLIYDGSAAESNLPAFSRVGEGGRNGLIEIFNANCGGYIDPDPLVMVDGGCKNVGQQIYSLNAPDHGQETGTGAPFRLQQAVSSARAIHTATAGQTVFDYSTKFNEQGADRTAALKVYVNNILLIAGAGAGKYAIASDDNTITLGTAASLGDKIKIGLATDYQKSLENCWLSVNATLGANAVRAAFFGDLVRDPANPTVRYMHNCGFKELKVVASAPYSTNIACTLHGINSYIEGAYCNEGKLSIAADAEYASAKGYFKLGVSDASSTSVIDDLIKDYVNNYGVNLKAFGAVGDGVTDDTVAVKAAIDSDQSIYVSDGVFLVASWPSGGVLTDSTLKMRGTGTIKAVGNSKVFVVIRNDADIKDVQFEGFKFVFENAFGSSASLDKFHLDNITVKNCGGGITLERPVNSFKVTNCLFDTLTADKPIRVGRNTYSAQDTWKNITITGNTFRNISTTGATDCNVMLVYGKQATITSNVIEGVTAVGSNELFNGTGSKTAFTLTESGLNTGQTTVLVGGVEQVNTDEDVLWSISGTTLTFTTAPASGTNNVKIVYFGESAGIYTKARFATITGNTISGITSGNVNQVYGINVKGKGRGDTSAPQGFNVTVTGNTLVGVNGVGSGIRIQNDFVNVTGNNIERFRFGVNGNTAGHNNSNITGNNIFHCQQYAIHVIQSGVNYIVQGNNIQGQVVGGVYEPLIGIKVRAFNDTSNYSIANNVISTCKKGIKLDQSATGNQINNVQIVNNIFNDVDDNGIEFAACNTILVKDNTYDGAVENNYIRAVNPNQNVRIVDSRTKTLNTASSTAIQTWNTSLVDQVVRVTAEATGRRTDDGEFASYQIIGLFKVVGGTLSQVGQTVSRYAIESDTGWTGITFDTNSNDIFLDVQAESGTINWTYQTEYVSSTDATI